MANEATAFYKRLASCLATNHHVLAPLLSDILPPPRRSAIQCTRGARPHCGHDSMMILNHHPPLTWPSLNSIAFYSVLFFNSLLYPLVFSIFPSAYLSLTNYVTFYLLVIILRSSIHLRMRVTAPSVTDFAGLLA